MRKRMEPTRPGEILREELSAQKAIDLYKAAQRITGLPRPLLRAS